MHAHLNGAAVVLIVLVLWAICHKSGSSSSAGGTDKQS
jgi:hypothetical protein